ncbi:MAG: extracellular solute-binding protein [Deltaproteobacteria bacterium]|nr:extracellular solute-binding protein [Deltaproteobacteria bacterium]
MLFSNSRYGIGLIVVLTYLTFPSFSATAAAADPKLIEAAKKEGGEVHAYATLRVDTSKQVWDLFEAKYPFLKVKQYKADSDKMLQRVLTEYRAGKYLVDVLNFGGFHTQVLIERGIAGPYLSPETKHYAPALKDKNGFWTTLYYNPLTIAYNTQLIPISERPRDWPDLLHSRWKGKIAMEGDHLTWYAAIHKRYGEEKGRKFMQALARQDLRLESSSRGIALLAAGEFSVFIGRGHTAQILKQRGAPLDWIRNPDPLAVHLQTVQIAKNAPHPNSAKLLIDFLLSETVAEIITKEHRLSGRSGVPGMNPAFKEIEVEKILPLSMEELLANYKRYLEEFRNLFGKG